MAIPSRRRPAYLKNTTGPPDYPSSTFSCLANLLHLPFSWSTAAVPELPTSPLWNSYMYPVLIFNCEVRVRADLAHAAAAARRENFRNLTIWLASTLYLRARVKFNYNNSLRNHKQVFDWADWFRLMATFSSQTSPRYLDGPMFKRAKVMKGWRYRWFVLDRHAGLLSYYTVSVLFKRRLHQ